MILIENSDLVKGHCSGTVAGMSAPSRARARVRAELIQEILAAAHEELAAEGAPGLSLRAIARRLEMVPSALYRYFPSRDSLLTALIIDAYEAVGAAAAAALASAGPAPLDRWLAVTRESASGASSTRTNGPWSTDRRFRATAPLGTPSRRRS